MPDLAERLEERADSYEQSGPSSHHTAALLREARAEVLSLRADVEHLRGIAHIAKNLQDRFDALAKLARRVCGYDWSDNDADAVAAIEELRRIAR